MRKNLKSFTISLITALVVVSISFLAFFYLNKISAEKTYKALEYAVETSSALLAEAYKTPLWNYAIDEVNDFSEKVLKTPEFIAINVYDTRGLVAGFKKINSNSIITINKVSKPFKINKNERWLHKKTVKIGDDIDSVGKFELFYTEQFIIESNKQAQISMIFFLVLLVFLLTVINYIMMKKLVIQPITKLSDKTQEIAKNKNYSMTIKKKGQDEISKLYSGFNNMLIQIRKKEAQREDILLSLSKRDEKYNYIFDKLKKAVNHGDYTRVKDFKSDGKELFESLNIFLKTLEISDIKRKKEEWLKTGQTMLSNAIFGEVKLEKLCEKAINYIANYLNAQVGVIYVKDNSDDSGQYFKFCSGYAFTKPKDFQEKFKLGEGLAGQVAYEKKTIDFSNMSADLSANVSETEVSDLTTQNTHLQIESSLQILIPHHILLFPLMYENEVKGVVELGSITQFPTDTIEFTKLSGRIIAVAINTALIKTSSKGI